MDDEILLGDWRKSTIKETYLAIERSSLIIIFPGGDHLEGDRMKKPDWRRSSGRRMTDEVPPMRA